MRERESSSFLEEKERKFEEFQKLDRETLLRKIQENHGIFEVVSESPNFCTREVFEIKKDSAVNENEQNEPLILTSQIVIESHDKKLRQNIKDIIPPKTYFVKSFYNHPSSNREIDKTHQFMSSRNELPTFYNFMVENDKTEELDSYVIYSDLFQTGGMLSLFHEIGHSFFREEVLEELDEAWEDIELSIEEAQKKQRTVPRKKDILIRVETEDGRILTIPVPRSEYLQYHALNAELERKSWAVALKILRKLRRQGFDIEPELKTAKDIEKFIHHPSSPALGDYEADFIREQICPNEKKILGIYSRKTYRLIEENKL